MSLLCLALLAALLVKPSHISASPEVGIPFKRSYPLEEVGVSRSVQLDFDPIGRLAAVDNNKYVVLNDSSWSDLLDENQLSRTEMYATTDSEGHTYFGGLAAWGFLERGLDGTLQRLSFRDRSVPSWVDATNFDMVLPVGDGAYFAGINGIVHWNRPSQTNTYIEAPDLVRIFVIEGIAYASTHSQGLCEISIEEERLIPLQTEPKELIVPFGVAALKNGQTIFSTTDYTFVSYENRQFEAWPNELGVQQKTQISNLLKLPDGNLAVAIDNRGLFVLSPNGKCLQALTASEYHRINDLAARENGVLWVVSESDIQKILYNDPVTILDQRSGITVSWPHIVEKEGSSLIVSHRVLYELAPAELSLAPRYQPTALQPPDGVLAAAEMDGQILMGNRDGVYVRNNDTLDHLIRDIEVVRILEQGESDFLAIGRDQIATLRWDGVRWFEPTPRITGVGFPFICLAAKNSVWIELGKNRAARLSIREGEIRKQVFEDFPWENASWVHIGVVDEIAVLSGLEGKRLYFDETTESFVETLHLQRLLDSAGFTVFRPVKDQNGIVWAAHENGICTIEERQGTFHLDFDSYRTIRDHVPVIHLSDGTEIWVSNGSTLYHVDGNRAAKSPAPFLPTLVSIIDISDRTLLYSVFETNSIPEEIPFARNDLEFHYFAGSYASANTPIYQFEMSNRATDWSVSSTESLISLTKLKEGEYQLSASMVDSKQVLGERSFASFTIAPPWYRTSFAYFSYWTLSAFLIALIALALATRSKRRHAELEALVHERTEELRDTLEKLNEKERKAAVLSERNRLASEIHDSVQQGLSGLALQIEATLKLPDLVDAVHSRLAVAKNMVSFTRHEVQQAVWGLESPLLENSDLATALKKMVSLVSSGGPEIEFRSQGARFELGASTQHHLLRIAQEAATNSIKHAEASKITVQLDFEKDRVSLEIADNGKGFDKSKTLNGGFGHFGLRGMKSRAAKIGGNLFIESDPQHGSTIRIDVTPSDSHR
ncbi:sensor histidine kinase [Pelagicoccus sp. SDUM812002]|nr:sensor histidine kinase [Pelagicoccus sp. SDUM812002]